MEEINNIEKTDILSDDEIIPIKKNKVFNNSDAVIEIPTEPPVEPVEVEEPLVKTIEEPIKIPKKKIKEDKRKTKPRTEKQILAFEKLQRRRAEQVELIKKQKEDEEESVIMKKKSRVKKKKEVVYESSDDEGGGRRKIINNYYYNYNPKEQIKPIEQQTPERPSAPTPDKQRPIVYFG